MSPDNRHSEWVKPGRVLALGACLGLALLLLTGLPAWALGTQEYDLSGDCPGGVGDVGVLTETIHTANADPGP